MGLLDDVLGLPLRILEMLFSKGYLLWIVLAVGGLLVYIIIRVRMG
jgi:hypothetical protein